MGIRDNFYAFFVYLMTDATIRESPEDHEQ